MAFDSTYVQLLEANIDLSLAHYGVWGLAALSRLPGSGINWDKASEEQQRKLSLLPAFMYHGVNTEEAVLMRMNQVPRRVAQKLGSEMRKSDGETTRVSVSEARQFVKDLKSTDWERVRPERSQLSGTQYREIWGILSGEGGKATAARQDTRRQRFLERWPGIPGRAHHLTATEV